MAIKDRPYVGSWEIGKQTIVRHTPDARVLINGQAEFAICATCNKKTDFNKYITSVSCDPSTDPISGASLSFSIPRHATDVFSHDGNYVLEPGLEVVIQMRGYFPVKGYVAKGQQGNLTTSSEVAEDGRSVSVTATDGSPLEETPVYPYYQVFRGVVTEVSHEFSGGFYTASLSCQNILHFWQYLYLSTNGSVFGKKPPDSGVQVDLTGHRFTGMSPYGIIYTLMRVGFGAAFGVNWTISQTTNISAVDEGTGASLYKHTAQWWMKRWEDSSMRLRMYGFDGTLFNAFEQAYLGLFDTKSKKNAGLVNKFTIRNTKDLNTQQLTQAVGKAAREVGYKGTETTAAIMDEGGHRLDAAKMQAYTLDLGRIGSVNFFESEYMSKLEIANAVKDITGFEFYQDVDGDIVFKPAYYNLDTSSDPVYRIEDRDLISITESESEPEATYVKGSGSTFANFTGILSGEFGTRGSNHVDWRLVAKFGWKETSFESNYYSSSKQMYIGAIMRLDTANMEMRSASITIPLRPEIRPGYPVYVEHLDCYFYVKSMSHSFSPGGACQTTLTCAAKRAKWLPPGLPDRAEGGSPLPRLDQVRLSAPGDYPPMPLYAFPEDMDGNSGGSSGPPRIIGYPNVVLALDPHKINPRTIPGLPTLTDKTLFDVALAVGALRRNPDDPENSYLLASTDDPSQSEVIQKSALLTAYNSVAEALGATGSTDTATAIESEVTDERLGQILNVVFQSDFSAIEDADNLSRYMALQRNLKNVFGASKEAGEYRYYSSSAPDVIDQSPSEFTYDQETGESYETVPGPADSTISANEITLLRQRGDRIAVESGLPTRGFRVYGLSPESDESPYVDVTTRDIRFINFSRHVTRVRINVSEKADTNLGRLPLDIKAMKRAFASELAAYATVNVEENDKSPVADLFGSEDASTTGAYLNLYTALKTYADSLGITSEKVNDLATFTNSFTRYTYTVSEGGSDAVVETDSTTGEETVLAEAVPPTQRTVRRTKTGTIKQVTGRSRGKGVQNLATKIGNTLGAALGVVQSALIKKARTEEIDLEAALEARTTFLKSFFEYEEVGGGGYTLTTAQYKETPHHTVVLPVSDNRGYEVYGTMAYGRGLNISGYATLLATQGSPSTASSMLAVETFFASLARNGADVTQALQALDEETKAELATALGTDTNNLEDTIWAISSDDSDAVYIRNTPVTSRSRGMSNTEAASIDALADLSGDGNTVCLCKGVEATHFLQAFTGEFVEITGDEAVNDFLTTEVLVSGESYKVTKQALAGQVLDTRFRNELERVGKNADEAVKSLGRTVEGAGQAIDQELTSGVNDIADAFNAIPDAFTDVIED